MLNNGVNIVSRGSNNSLTFSKADYDYFAFWAFPTIKIAQEFEKMVEGAGWYNYLQQVNAMGAAASPQDTIEIMMNL